MSAPGPPVDQPPGYNDGRPFSAEIVPRVPEGSTGDTASKVYVLETQTFVYLLTRLRYIQGIKKPYASIVSPSGKRKGDAMEDTNIVVKRSKASNPTAVSYAII
jgi:hypothetical protein